MKSWFMAGMLALAVGGTAGVASAGSVQLEPGDQVGMTLSSLLSPGLVYQVQVNNPESYNYYAGALNWNLDSVTRGGTTTYYPTGLKPTLYTFCIQMKQNVYLGSPATFDVVPLDAAGPVLGGGDAHQLTDYQAALIQGLVDHHVNDINTNIGAAAMQVAIWEIVYDLTASGISPNLYSGSFAASYASSGADGQAALNQAENWLNGVHPDYDVSSLALISDTYQDQMIGIVTPVPLPAAAGVGFGMLAGFGGLFGLRKQLKRRTKIA